MLRKAKRLGLRKSPFDRAIKVIAEGNFLEFKAMENTGHTDKPVRQWFGSQYSQSHNWRKQDLLISIKNALRGIWHILNHHYNARLIFLFSVFVVLLGFYLQVSNLEMFVLGVAVIVLFISEVINTIIEDMINLITQEYHLEIKIIKDVAAGVVLVAVFFFATLCYCVFVKRVTIVLRSIDYKSTSEITSYDRR